MKNSTEPIVSKPRFTEIDLLKAFAAFLVIFIHISSRYSGLSEFNYQLWDYAHFAVGIFVFASGYLLATTNITATKFKDYLKWAYKRFIRIYVPYLIFLPPMYLATMFKKGYVKDGAFSFSNSWEWIQSTFNFDFWFRTFTMETEGVGNSWIPRLFLWLSLFYLIAQILKPYWAKYYYAIFAIVATWVSYFFLLNDSDYFKRDQRVVGWGLIMIFGMFVYWNIKNFKKVAIASFIIFPIIFAITWNILSSNGVDTTLFTNKYPPTLFYISYQLFTAMVALSLFRLFANWVAEHAIVKRIVDFYSVGSYDIFFFHLVVMEVLFMFKWGLIPEMIVVTAITTGIVYLKREVLKIKI